jgi:hypothetical protein
MSNPNRYSQIIERIFFKYYIAGMREFVFPRADIETAAAELGIKLPKNIGDVLYSFRYRAELPDSVRATAGVGETWIIRPAGRGVYRFVLVADIQIVPDRSLDEIKILDSTPGLIARYALSDEQALLAKLRYNRLIDIFTRVTCYSLQNHLRTTIPDIGQIETDELYMGVDKHGAHYVLPVQAKGGRDKLSVVQIEQDFALCATKFPALICRPIGAQFIASNLIALFEFRISSDTVRVVQQKHYLLTTSDQLSNTDLQTYRQDALPDNE